MLTTTQIVLISIIAVCLLLSVVFMIMFIVEVMKGQKTEEEETEQVVQSVFTVNVNETNAVEEKKEENSVSEMLASLEEQTKDEQVEEVPAEEPANEVVEEPANETAEEPVSEPESEPVVEEVVEDEAANEAASETDEESEETADEKAEEPAEIQEETDTVSEIKNVGHGIVYSGNLNEYKARLESVINARNKIERDLTKRQKAILKYERTKRRMNRNQKMLDRRAGELTNLNLLMYSVTDIKNIDEDKKAKQEDLTAHIAELKASIQDADEYIESNKGKNENNIKMAKYLLNEKNRYNEEIAELEELIKAIESNNPNA